MSEPSLTPPATRPDAPVSDRLDAWKDIAIYLKRDISTVQRWERREAMPVHRHLHDLRGSVYAFRSELDRWVASRGFALESNGRDVVGEPGAPELSRHRLDRWWLLVTVLLVLGMNSAADHLSSGPARTGPPAIRSIAVLPLQNLSGDAAQEYLADGITEAVIGYLSVIHGLRVVSRTSIMQFKGTRESVPEIARKLSVDAIVEGSVSRVDNRVRINAQLIRGSTDEHVWSASYEHELRDVLAVESEIAHAVARQVEITIDDDRHYVRGTRSVAPEVYDNYLKGRFALNRNTKWGAQESIAYFEAVIEADPSFALAYSGLATAYTDLGLVLFGAPPHEVRPKVFTAARKALSLDPDLIEAHVQLGDALQQDWRWKEAEAEFRRAVALGPNSATANTMLGRYLICRGRFDEAIAAAQRGKTLDPLALRGEHLGWILFMSRRYKEAIRAIEDVLAIRPEDPTALWELGFVHLFDRQPVKAVKALERAAETTERSPAVLGVLVRAYVDAGRVIDARRILDEMLDRQREEYVPSASFINAYVGLGDREHTFMWLERGFDERSNILQYLKVHPAFDDIRSDPRFSNLVQRVGLAE
jgi:pentatricopeptide repeat protein